VLPARVVAGPGSAREQPVIDGARHKCEKLVRDGFTIPKSEYTVLDSLKQPIKGSELLRAGLKALAAMGNPAFRAAL